MSSAMYQQFYRERHPDRYKARQAVARAVRSGKLPKASSCVCFRCGNPAVHYHHQNGYDKTAWLDVEPVCLECHNIIDRLEPLAEWHIPEEELERTTYADLEDEERGAPGFLEQLENANWRNGRIWQGEPQ